MNDDCSMTMRREHKTFTIKMFEQMNKEGAVWDFTQQTNYNRCWIRSIQHAYCTREKTNKYFPLTSSSSECFQSLIVLEIELFAVTQAIIIDNLFDPISSKTIHRDFR